MIERDSSGFGQFAELLIRRSGIKIRCIQLLRQQSLVPFRVIPRIGPFLYIRSSCRPMRCKSAKPDGRYQMGCVLNNKPTRKQVGNAWSSLWINARTHGYTNGIPRRRTTRSSFPAQWRSNERFRLETCAVGFPRPITRHQNGLGEGTNGQTSQ